MSLRFSYVITFFLSLLCFFILFLLQLNELIYFVFAFIIIFAIVMYPILKISFWETNLEKIENFLVKNKKNANFYIIYALANKTDDEVKSITNKLVAKTKNKSRIAHYKMMEAIYFKDLTAARKIVVDIVDPKYRNYYEAMIAIEDGDEKRAEELMKEIPNNWMYYALLVVHEQKKNNLAKAKKYAQKAIEETKGLQRYLLHKTYEREFSTQNQNKTS